MKYDELSPVQDCPKCRQMAPFLYEYIAKKSSRQINGELVFGECIIRTCTSCDWKYATKCADAE